MMKTEKTIKAQARIALRQGNWATLVGCLAIMLISFLLIDFIYEALIYGFNLVNLSTMEFKKSGVILGSIFTILSFGLLILISPIINGFSKLCYNVAKNESCTSIDLFYYFRSFRLYFKALGLNILRYLIVFLIVLALSFPAGVMFLLSESFSSFNTYFQFVGIVLEIAGLIFSFCFYTKTVLCNYILAEDDSKNAAWYIKNSFQLSKGHNIDIIKLILSFIFWLLSCFFIFPIFYVIPYMGVSLGTSAKWLILLKKEVSYQNVSIFMYDRI